MNLNLHCISIINDQRAMEYMERKSIPNDEYSTSLSISYIANNNNIVDTNHPQLNTLEREVIDEAVKIRSSRCALVGQQQQQHPQQQTQSRKRKRDIINSSSSKMNHSKNPSCSPQRTTMAHKGNLTSNLQQKFDDILQTQISKKSDWDTIHNIIQTSKHLSAISYYINNDKLCISQYHLYKMVSQKILPVPPRIINLALTSNPDLADSKVYALNVIVAFENHSSLPESLFQLINKSENSSTLVYNVLHKIIHRVDDNDHSDTMIGNELMIQRLLDSSRRNRNNHLGLASIPEENLRVFIHETFLDALYFQDEDGNTLLQQACLNCKSPRIVRLIIEGMMNDVGWWCVLGDNTQKRTPFQLALSSNATYLEISSVLSELLSVIPVQDLPSKFRIQSNDILHASIRTENMYLMFHILKAYPDLLYTWSSEGTLPFHDICRYGSSEVIGEFIVLFEEQVSSQSLIMTKNCPYFVPIQIACVNPASSMDNVYQLIRLISKEKRSMLWSDIIQVNGLLHLVAATSNIAVAKMLLSMCPQALTNNQFEAFGKGPSPLFYACVRGTPAMIEFLFKLGMSDPYHPIYHGGLIDSFSGNELHPIRALCSNHQMTYQSTRTLLHHSKIKMDWMWENRLLHCAAYEGNLEVAMAFVDHNPRLLHCKDEDGNTPLHGTFHMNHTAFFITQDNPNTQKW